jgi:phage gp36-like protein
MTTAMLSSVPSDQQTQACLDASAQADSYLRGRYALPLASWGQDVRRMTGYIACYMLMSARGFSSSSGADQLILQRYYEAVGTPGQPGSGWFVGVQRQTIHPDVTPAIAQPGDPVHDIPQVHSDPPRGWPRFYNGRSIV